MTQREEVKTGIAYALQDADIDLSSGEEVADFLKGVSGTGGFDLPAGRQQLNGRYWKLWLEESAKAQDLANSNGLVAWLSRKEIQIGAEPGTFSNHSRIREENNKFYIDAWKAKAKEQGIESPKCHRGLPILRCEESGVPIKYSAAHVSHNLSRGAYPDPFFRLNPDNVTILSFVEHSNWEDSEKRKSMKIYPEKKKVMARMLNDFLKIKK